VLAYAQKFMARVAFELELLSVFLVIECDRLNDRRGWTKGGSPPGETRSTGGENDDRDDDPVKGTDRSVFFATSFLVHTCVNSNDDATSEI
jgi:hypothetical protein